MHAIPDTNIDSPLQTREWDLKRQIRNKRSVMFTDSFGYGRPPRQLQPRHKIFVEVVNVRKEFHGQCGRCFVTLENWLVMPAGTENFHQVSVAEVVRQRTCGDGDACGTIKQNQLNADNEINYSISLSPVVIITRDFVGHSGCPSTVTDWLIGSGTSGL